MKYSCFSFIIMVLAFGSCEKKEKLAIDLTSPFDTIDFTKANSTEQYYFSDIFQIEAMVPLETSADFFVSKSPKVVTVDGNYYIHEKKLSGLYVFNTNGRFLHQIGKLGQGPGEYYKISDFDIDKEKQQVLVYSNSDRAVMVYSLEGEFIKEIDVPFFSQYFTVLDENTWLFYSGYNLDEEPFNLFSTNNEGKITGKYFKYPLNNLKGFDFTGLLRKSHSSGALYTEPLSNIIYRINQDSITQAYKIEFGKKGWPEEDRYNHNKFFIDNMGLESSFLYSEIFETEDLLIFNYQEKQRERVAFIMKEKGKLYTHKNFNNDGLYPLFHTPVGIVDKNTWITIIYPEDIFNKTNGNTSFIDGLKGPYPKLYTLTKAIKEEDNPILVTFKLK